MLATALCKNCEAALDGPYCSQCGQEVRDPDPSVRELVAEFVSEQLGVDGKLPTTFTRLLLRPGQLTVDYLAGRRAGLLSPLRVYLLCSVLFFAVSALVPEPREVVREATPASARGDEGTQLVKAKIAQMRASPSRLQHRVADNLERQVERRDELHRWKATAVPKLMFVLVPLLAGLTALAVRGRARFPAHLAFALHVHAFAFLAMLVFEAGIAIDRIDAIVVGTFASWAIMLAYLALALRRAYSLRLAGAIGRAVAIGLGYYLGLSLAMVVAVALRAEV